MPPGLTSGDFSTDDCISLCDVAGLEFARGLSNFSSADAQLIIGRPNEEHGALLGYIGSEYLVHRDNISILPSKCVPHRAACLGPRDSRAPRSLPGLA